MFSRETVGAVRREGTRGSSLGVSSGLMRAEAEEPWNSLCHVDRCRLSDFLSPCCLADGWRLWVTSDILAQHAAGLWKLEARMLLNTLQHRGWSPSPNTGLSVLNGNGICIGPFYSECDPGSVRNGDYFPWCCDQNPPRNNLRGRVYLGSWIVGTPSITVGKHGRQQLAGFRGW